MSFWRKNFSTEEIEFLLNEVRSFRSVAETGEVSFTGLGSLDGLQAILTSATCFNARTDSLKTQVIFDTLFSKELPNDFSEHDFRKIANQHLEIIRKSKEKIFHVVYPVWNKPSFLNSKFLIDDTSLNFSSFEDANFFVTLERERQKQTDDPNFKEFFTKKRMSDLGSCSLCIATVKACSAADAQERASEAIYEVIGLINIAKDEGKYWRISSGRFGKLPVSEVLIGPHTTVHNEAGQLAFEGFWYENWNGGGSRATLNSEKMQIWEKNFIHLLERLNTSQWRDLCRSAARRYFKAFSTPDLEESFLDGWRLFENITGHDHEKIETKLLRASNVFRNNIENNIIGKHLAMRRNLISHGHRIKSNDEETLAFQMLQFVLPYLRRFIVNKFDFSSIEEFWEFLELPASKDVRDRKESELNRKLDLLQKAAKFRGEVRSQD